MFKRPFYNELYPNLVFINNLPYRVFLADADEYFIVEVEQHHASGVPDFNIMSKFHDAVAAIRNAESHHVLYATAVHLMKQQFGFDRVMMYVFDELGDGHVVAEEKEFGLEPFLGLKYPASDIPKQARALYITNLSRAINDIHDNGIAINCYLPEKKELDLSYAVFRSVSPVHIQYLQNMGVTATHAISIIIDKALWGMIIFHHYSGPKHIDFNQRLLAQTLAVNVAQSVEIIRAHEEKINMEAIEFVLKKMS